MLPFPERLTRRRDFAAVYARKRSWVGPLVVLYVRHHDTDSPDAETRRWGFSVSKKVGKAAHDRNRVKRRLRDICRLHGADFRRGFDAVLVARGSSVTADYSELDAAVCAVVRRANLWGEAAKESAAEPVIAAQPEG